jgi:hypothetical protein
MEEPLRKNLLCSLSLLGLALCLVSVPALAQETFFNDFGSGFNYQSGNGWTVSGTQGTGTSFTAANEFTAMASGSIGQIDIGIGWVLHPSDQFYAALYTVGNNGLPDQQLFREDNLTSGQEFGGCCGIVTISGISGVTLNAGQQYFLVLGPENINENGWLAWNWNSTGATGIDLFSTDGGGTWTSNGEQTISAFDILGSGQQTVPEPSSFLLLGGGLVGAFSTMRKKIKR